VQVDLTILKITTRFVVPALTHLHVHDTTSPGICEVWQNNI
jgi:hypothetical protein